MYKNKSFFPLSSLPIILISFLPISLIMGNFSVNLNIILINLVFLYYSYQRKNWYWLKDDVFKMLIIFYFYLILNTLISSFLNNHYDLSGLIRSVGFIKFILLGYAFNLLIQDYKILNKIMINWLVIIGIVILDVFFERIFGHNTLGYISLDGTRIVSFFKDELIVGSLILTFGFVITTYFLNKDLRTPSKIFFNIFILIVPLSIFISGERSNFIKSLIIFLLIIFLINESKLLIKKYKFVLLILFALFMSTFLSHNIYSKQTEFIKRVINVEKPKKFMDRFENIKYFAHYDVALKIFFDNPFFGIGNKNFRYECHNEKYFDSKIKFSNARCNTHPHQVHFEILSEHGIVGYLFLLSIFFIFIKKKINHANLSKNIFSYSVLMYLIIFFTPLIPSGAFFSTYSGTLFWIIFSIANLDKNKISL